MTLRLLYQLYLVLVFVFRDGASRVAGDDVSGPLPGDLSFRAFKCLISLLSCVALKHPLMTVTLALIN